MVFRFVFGFEGTVILDSSMAEHSAVNRRVAGSSPARGDLNRQADKFVCFLSIQVFYITIDR